MQVPVLSELSSAHTDRLAHARAVVLDMDGTLVLGDSSSAGHRPLPGAVELLPLLRARGIPFRVFTNGTAKTPEVYAQALRKAGLDVQDEEVMTPSSAAAVWLSRLGIRRVRVLGLEGVQGPLRRAGLEVVGPCEAADQIDAVYTGWFREFSFPDLESACRDIWAGAVFTTASNVPFFAARGGRAIGASFAINAMIRALTGQRATVLGKPSRAALACALRLMGLPRSALGQTVVVGDDPALEMRMARGAGALAVAVTTGLNDRHAFETAAVAERPDVILSGLAPLLAVYA
jgi:4-nitrophenyl phosphatase